MNGDIKERSGDVAMFAERKLKDSGKKYISFKLSEEKYDQLEEYLETSKREEARLGVKHILQLDYGTCYVFHSGWIVRLNPEKRTAVMSRTLVNILGNVLGGFGE